MEIDQDDLVTFMKKMQMSVETITKEIKRSNEDLGREIRESRQELKVEIKLINSKLGAEIEEIRKETKTVRREVADARKEGKERMSIMEGRLKELETETKRQETNKRKREELLADNHSPAVLIEPAGLNYSEAVKPKTQKATKDIETEPVYKSSWARRMSQVSLETQLKVATEAAAKLENQKDGESEFKGRERRNKKVIKMGDSLERHDELDWPWDGNEEEWDGTIDKAERNKAKKEVEKKSKVEKIGKAALVGKCLLGIGPIKE